MTKLANTAGALNPENAVFHNITQVETSSGISAGIRVRALAPGLVPVFEEHHVRREGRYSLKEWYDGLSPEERAMEVALYRIGKAVEAHETDAHIESSKKK